MLVIEQVLYSVRLYKQRGVIVILELPIYKSSDRYSVRAHEIVYIVLRDIRIVRRQGTYETPVARQAPHLVGLVEERVNPAS